MGNIKSTFWLDKQQRLWKVHYESSEEEITQQMANIREILKLRQSANNLHLLFPDKIIQNTPLSYAMRSPLAEIDLFDYIKTKFNINIVKAGLIQITAAIHFLHDHNIAHRDVKTENIVIHNGDFKLIDFDFARESTLFYLCGTKTYMCPFSDRWQCNNQTKSERMDYYAFGITIWSVLWQASMNKMLRRFNWDQAVAGMTTFDLPPWDILTHVANHCCQKIPTL